MATKKYGKKKGSSAGGKSEKKGSGVLKVLAITGISLVSVILAAVLGMGVWHIVRNSDGGVAEGSSIRYYNSWKYTDGADGKYEMKRLGEFFARNTVIKINKITDNGDGTGKADITVTAPDFRELLKWRFRQKMTDGEDVDYAEVLESIEDSLVRDFYVSRKRVTTNLTVDLVKDGDEWKIVRSDEYDAAVTGDAMKVYLELLTEIIGEE